MEIEKFKVEDWFNKYEKLSTYDMADTCVESLSLNELLNLTGDKEKSLEELFDKKLNYGEIQGSNRLKKAIRTLYNTEKPITITHGAIGANSLVIQSLVEAGDKVISVVPTYQQHYSIPKSFGADVNMFFLEEKNNWLPDIEELKKRVNKDIKLICINNPNNPTGAVIPKEILEQIVHIAKENNCYILCDEVYRGLEHNGEKSVSIADIYDKGISTGSMSKVYSLAGLRLGWIVAPDEVMEKIIVQREYNTISVSIIDDYFAAIAIENSEKIIKRNLEKILEGKKILSTWVEKEPNISWVEPQGGTTCLLKYNLPMKSVDLCEKLLKDTGVLFLPASAMEMEGYIRAGYCSDISKLQKGLNIFSEWLEKEISSVSALLH